jgi:hypothetical protein
MSERSDAYRRRAQECEAAAERVSDPDVSAAYVENAARWRRMAMRQEEIEKALSEVRTPPNDPAQDSVTLVDSAKLLKVLVA